jgi:uncharacterized protein (TIGR03437 family)
MPRFLFFFLLATSLFAQSTPSPDNAYVTTDDGSVLYFVSNFELRGSAGATMSPKMFKADKTGFSLVVKIPYAPKSFYAILEPRVSGDGSVVGYVATQGCGNSCNLYYPDQGYQTTLQYPGGAPPITLPYYCQISRNAMYALCVTAAPALQEVVVVNLSNMQMSAPQMTACHGKNLITADGRALAWDKKQIVLFSSMGQQTIATDAFGCPVISDDGSMIVYPSHQGMVAYTVSNGTTRSLTPVCSVCNLQSPNAITNDGRQVLAGNALFPTDGSGSIAVNTSYGASEILSGDGTTLYEDLTKIDVASGKVTILSTPTPQIFPQGIWVAGSYYLVSGVNLTSTSASAASFPGPTNLAGVQILVNGTAVPLLYVSPGSVAFQLPFETPHQSTLEVLADTGSPFVQGVIDLVLGTFRPYQLGSAINENFTSLITQSNPANPGDVVNFYVTGMGAVTTAVTDAVPAPASPLPLLASPITVSYKTTPLKIYYAGLAPGLIGIYQVTVETPTQVPQPPDGSGPTVILLDIQLNPPQSAAPFLLQLWMNPNQ